MIVVEKLWPAVELPRVRAWWARVIAVNAVQLGIVLLAGVTWDRWLLGASLFHLRDRFGVAVQGALAYLVSGAMSTARRSRMRLACRGRSGRRSSATGSAAGGPLRRELGVPAGARHLRVRIATRTRGRHDVWVLEAPCVE